VASSSSSSPRGSTDVPPAPLTAGSSRPSTRHSPDASRSIATALDDKSITFEYATRKGSGWKWEHVSDNQWRAVISWTASANRVAGERIYTMDRIAK